MVWLKVNAAVLYFIKINIDIKKSIWYNNDIISKGLKGNHTHE